MTNENLPRLLHLLEKLRCIIAEENAYPYSHCLRTVERMERNIRAALALPCDTAELYSLLEADWKGLFPPKSGLTAFYLWRDEYKERLRLNREYEAIRKEIDVLILCRNETSSNPK